MNLKMTFYEVTFQPHHKFTACHWRNENNEIMIRIFKAVSDGNIIKILFVHDNN
jgi:hypothetical protein